MIKKLTFIALLLTLSLGVSAQKNSDKADKKEPSSGQEITLKIKGLKDTMVHLANYFGDKTYYADSGRTDKNGTVVFRPKKRLDCGVYIVAVNGAKFFEFIVREDKFTIETDTANYLGSIKAYNSEENARFLEYQAFTNRVGEAIYYLNKQLTELQQDPAKNRVAIDTIKNNMRAAEKNLVEFRNEFVQKYGHLVIGKIIKAMKEVDVPDAPADITDSTARQLYQYNYYKEHYWDNVDFTDDCLLRTPIFHGKLQRYMEKISMQFPDSLIKCADHVVALARKSPEMFKYTVWWITQNYERSTIMCMDGVFVHMALTYYTYKDAFWLDSADVLRIRTRAEALKPILCNVVAPNIEMHDSTLEKKIVAIVEADSNEQSRAVKLGILLSQNKTVNLHDVKAKFTLIVFWDPDCSHCQKEIPVIKKTYDSLKKYGLEVYAVGVEQDLDKWIKYVHENKLNWINVIDVYNISKFRSFYDISSTPVLYLLDKDKKIIAKRLSAEQFEKVITEDLDIMGLKKKNNPSPKGN